MLTFHDTRHKTSDTCRSSVPVHALSSVVAHGVRMLVTKTCGLVWAGLSLSHKDTCTLASPQIPCLLSFSLALSRSLSFSLSLFQPPCLTANHTQCSPPVPRHAHKGFLGINYSLAKLTKTFNYIK
jgi:hypothetical protein